MAKRMPPSPPTRDSKLSIIEEEFENRLLEAWQDDLLRAAQKASQRAGYSRKHEAVEDIAQEAGMSLLLAGRRMKTVAEAYFRRTVANAVRNAARREYRTRDFVTLDEVPPSLFPTCTSPKVVPVRNWLDRQPRNLRQVFEHLYVQGLTQRETAKAMGISQPRVAQLHRDLKDRGRRAFTADAAKGKDGQK